MALHTATLVTTIPPIWILLPFAMFGVSAVVTRMIRDPLKASFTLEPERLGFVLLAYAIGMFIYVYRVNGGATDVALRDGVYVSLYKDHVVKTLTREEFVRFPNLWTRALTAWIGAIAWFGN